MTFAPCLNRLSIVRATYSSLPGMGLALTMTVSPGSISTQRWSRLAMRASPAIGSPCAPVVAMTRRSAGVLRIWSLAISCAWGYSRYPSSVAMRTFCSMLRPTTATFRSKL